MKKHLRLFKRSLFFGLSLLAACDREELPKDERLLTTLAGRAWTQSSVSADCALTRIKRLDFQPDGTYRMEFDPKTFPGSANNIVEKWGGKPVQISTEHLFKRTGTYQVRNGTIELTNTFPLRFGYTLNDTLAYRDTTLTLQVNWRIEQADGSRLKVTSEKKPIPDPIECTEFVFVPL